MSYTLCKGTHASKKKSRLVSQKPQYQREAEIINKQKRTHSVVSELHPRHHQQPPVPRLPVVVRDQTALARGALALRDARHAELDVRRRVERRGVQDRDAVPARLHLHGQVPLVAVLRGGVVEDGLEGGVLQRGAVDVAGDPVVVEDRRALGMQFSILSAVRLRRERTRSSWNM